MRQLLVGLLCIGSNADDRTLRSATAKWAYSREDVQGVRKAYRGRSGVRFLVVGETGTYLLRFRCRGVLPKVYITPLFTAKCHLGSILFALLASSRTLEPTPHELAGGGELSALGLVGGIASGSQSAGLGGGTSGTVRRRRQ